MGALKVADPFSAFLFAAITARKQLRNPTQARANKRKGNPMPKAHAKINVKQAGSNSNKGSDKIAPKANSKRQKITAQDFLAAIIAGKVREARIEYFAVMDCEIRSHHALFDGPQKDKHGTGLSYQVRNKRGEVSFRGCRLDCITRIGMFEGGHSWTMLRVNDERDALDAAKAAHVARKARIAEKAARR